MENSVFTPLMHYMPESTAEDNEMIFLDNFDLEASPELRRVLGSLSKIEISPNHNLVDKLIHYSKSLDEQKEIS